MEMEDGGDEEVDVPAIESAVEDLAGALGLEVVAEEGDDEGDDEGFGEEEDEDLDLDLEEMDAEPGMQEMHREADGMDEDDLVEISESVLRREIARMRNKTSRRTKPSRVAEARRRNARRRRLAEMGDPVEANHEFADEVIEVTKDDLVNALAEELGTDPSEDLSVDGMGNPSDNAEDFGGGSIARGVVPESRRRHSARRAQSRRRRATRSTSIRESRNQKALLQARKAASAAKRELQESNLFNAKLLYVNKLMQQHDLNSKQQRAIVEALDNAKTHREAKLLYTSLTESLRRRKSSRSGGRLSEGLVRGGSSSNPTKSAAPANNGVGLDRWATLAGIKK